MDDTPTPAAKTASPFRWWAGGLLIGLLVGGLATAVEYRVAQRTLDTARDNTSRTLAGLQQDLEQERAEHQTARAFEALLRARVGASRARDDLDQSNFGSAREQLRMVGLALTDVNPTVTGIDPLALEAARGQVREAVDQVPADPTVQRARIVAIEHALDGLMPTKPRG